MYYANKNKIFHELKKDLTLFTKDTFLLRTLSPNLTKKNSQVIDMLIGYQTEICMKYVFPIFYRYHEKITAKQLVTDYNKMSMIFNDIIASGTEKFGNLLSFEYITRQLHGNYKNTIYEQFCIRLADVIDIWSCVDTIHPNMMLATATFRFDNSGHKVEGGEFNRAIFSDLIHLNDDTLYKLIRFKSFSITTINAAPKHDNIEVKFIPYSDYTNNLAN